MEDPRNIQPPQKSIPASTNGLFRQQAVEEIHNRLHGTIILARPLSLRLFTAVFFFLTVSLCIFFASFSTSRKVQAQGILLPVSGVNRVLASAGGIVVSQSAVEGQAVKAGDILFVLSNERSSSSSVTAQKTISLLLANRRESFRSDLNQIKPHSQQLINAVRRRMSVSKEDTKRIDEQISLQQQRIAITEQAFKRYTDLQSLNFISAAQLQEKQTELIEQKQKLSELLRLKGNNRRDMEAAESEISELRLQAQRDAAVSARNVSLAEQEFTDNEAKRESLIRAPQDGIVTGVTTTVGQSVVANQALGAILPAGTDLQAEIYVTSRSVGFVKPGMLVLLRYQAYPYQKFGQYVAHVTSISNTSLRSEDLNLSGASLATSSNSESLYRITLRLERQTVNAYGKATPLRSGMLVDASIVLDSRKLYEWVLEPLFSISGRSE